MSLTHGHHFFFPHVNFFILAFILLAVALVLNPLARKNQRDEHEDSVREPVIRDFEQLKAAIKSELEKYTDIKLEEKEHDLNVFAANGRWEFISSTGIFRFAPFQKKTIR
mgnify:FL=1